MFNLESYHQFNIIKDEKRSYKQQSQKISNFNPKYGYQNNKSTTIDIN